MDFLTSNSGPCTYTVSHCASSWHGHAFAGGVLQFAGLTVTAPSTISFSQTEWISKWQAGYSIEQNTQMHLKAVKIFCIM